MFVFTTGKISHFQDSCQIHECRKRHQIWTSGQTLSKQYRSVHCFKKKSEIKHEANGPHCSPEKHFLAINKLWKSYDFTSTIIKPKNPTKCVNSYLRKEWFLCKLLLIIVLLQHKIYFTWKWMTLALAI